MTKKTTSYKDAGVNIDIGNSLVEKIKPFAANTKRKGTIDGLGGFGGIFDLTACQYKDPLLVSATDGVGTKLKIAFETNQHHTIGIDLVAMCVNDIVVQGAEPLFFLDYFATSALSLDTTASVIEGISKGCTIANCTLIGGETAEMPGMYQKDHYDLAGFCVGAVERKHLLPKPTIQEGDTILGLASSGIHSNGFSLVRHILDKEQITYSDSCPVNPEQTIGNTLLTPTRIYVRPCLQVKELVKGFAHITGGGLIENIPRVLPATLTAEIDCTTWELPPIFKWLQSIGNVDHKEMLRTFNCGIGMVLIVSQESASTLKRQLEDNEETVYTIGKLVKYTDSNTKFLNIDTLFS